MVSLALSATSTPGFSNPVHDSQHVFRAVMNALARPTQVQALTAVLSPPSPLTPELAAIALALADGEAPLWLDAPLAATSAVIAYLRFHTSAPIVADLEQAAFALVSDPVAFQSFDGLALGTDDYPDRSTTMIMAVEEYIGGEGLTLHGPGMRDQTSFAPTPVPKGMSRAILDNRVLFPRGIDFILVAPGQVAAIPRSSRLVGGN